MPNYLLEIFSKITPNKLKIPIITEIITKNGKHAIKIENIKTTSNKTAIQKIISDIFQKFFPIFNIK
jgi:hypothetical protein